MSRLYSTCIPPVSHPPYPWYPTVSLYIYLHLATLQQVHCIPLSLTVSSCIRTYLAVSSCIPLYLTVSPPPPSKTGYGQKYTLQGRAILHIHTCMYMYLCIGIGGGEAICIYKSRNVHVHVPIYTTHYPIYTTFIKNLCLCIYHDQNEGCMLCKC